MTNVAVVHASLAPGGSERVCFSVVEALQRDYDVTLLTEAEPDFAARNEFYGTAVDPESVTVRGLPAPLAQCFDAFANRCSRLKWLAYNRYLRRIEYRYDLLVSTMNEFDLSGPSVQYVHYPRFPRLRAHGASRGGPADAVYHRCCDRIDSVDSDALNGTRVLANSAWTASVVAEHYAVTPEVVYPPVPVDRVEGRPWEERERGFVTVGRLAPRKCILALIDLVAALVAAGHDLHYHVVGPPTERAYARRVQSKADRYDFVHVEGALPRDELDRLLATHRWGLHGMRHEHFGIAVAEMAAAGMLPFAPDSGGQREILAPAPELLYADLDRAVGSVGAVLSDPGRQRDLRARLRDRMERFRTVQFTRAIRTVVREELS